MQSVWRGVVNIVDQKLDDPFGMWQLFGPGKLVMAREKIVLDGEPHLGPALEGKHGGNGDNRMACTGQVLAQVVEPTMQFSGSTTTAFLRSKSKRQTSRLQPVTQVPQPMQASSMTVGCQSI